MISVKANLNIFVLYSFLNSVGYDDENNKNGMHPQRVAIRNNLLKKIENLDITALKSYYQKYYLEKKIHLIHFNTYALSLSNDGNFDLVNTNFSTKLLPDLNLILKSFYNKFDIKALWNAEREGENAILAKYTDISENIVRNVQEYFYEKQDSKVMVTVVPNLLESYFRNKSILVDKELYLIFGPYTNNEPNMEGIVHEYLHLLVNPVIAKCLQEINNKSSFFDSVAKTEQLVNSYNNWHSYFSESIVRALAIAVYKEAAGLAEEEFNKNLDNLSKQGFILSKKILALLSGTAKPYKIESLVLKTLENLEN